ncbi:NAD(P)-binding protein [Mycena rebaudengoi]|nr:NAD(P)-binding protein [Mycena rebaudengoi]
MDLGLKGVHVLVTGASGGIGLAVVQVFLEQGANVTAHYNTISSTLDGFVSGPLSSQFRAVQADLTKESDVERLFGENPFGLVQVAVINHGIWPTADVLVRDMSLEQWTRTIETNLTASFLVARGYLRQLDPNAENPCICFIGSSSGRFGEAYHADYAASKSAMMYGLTYTLKNEIIKITPKGRVNTVAPGWVVTPLAEEALKKPAVVYAAMATTAMRKVGLPFDVATQVAFISSSKTSGHVSGEVIMVNGGMEGRLLNKPEDM